MPGISRDGVDLVQIFLPVLWCLPRGTHSPVTDEECVFTTAIKDTST